MVEKTSIKQAFRILELLAKAERPMDVSELVRRSEILKRTTFRILETLQSEMLVSKKHLTAEYVLGEKFVCVTCLSLENNY